MTKAHTEIRKGVPVTVIKKPISRKISTSDDIERRLLDLEEKVMVLYEKLDSLVK